MSGTPKKVLGACAGHIGRGEALIGDHARGERVTHARQQQRRPGAEHVAKITA